MDNNQNRTQKMRCIFCKNDSSSSKSVEHIIPESLGNKSHVLQKGIVCDCCNNYFATKIEKMVLEKPYFKNVRYRNFIETKKGRLVPDKTLFPHKEGGWVDVWLDEKGIIFDSKDRHVIDLITEGKINKLIMPIINQPEENDYDISRFLGKIALEFLTYKFTNDISWIEEIATKPELDPLRNYARFGKGSFWKYHQRRIYSEETRFTDPIHHPEPYEILHEMDILYTEDNVMYFILVIMGIEFAINLAHPETDYYVDWLQKNNNTSPIRRYSERMITEKHSK
ncbi:HNH endonuclease [Aquipluma nitroreducens]|nr:HNH endonuclease [Aquipluma nitroreducens]